MKEVIFVKNLTRLYMASTAIAVIYAVLQRRELNKIRNGKAALDNISDIQGKIVEGASRGVEVVESWLKDGKITLTMAEEYTDAVDVDDETRTKIKNL